MAIVDGVLWAWIRLLASKYLRKSYFVERGSTISMLSVSSVQEQNVPECTAKTKARTVYRNVGAKVVGLPKPSQAAAKIRNPSLIQGVIYF